MRTMYMREAKVNFREANDPKGYLQKADLILDFAMTDANLEEIWMS